MANRVFAIRLVQWLVIRLGLRNPRKKERKKFLNTIGFAGVPFLLRVLLRVDQFACGSVPFGSIPFGSVPFGSVPLGSIPSLFAQCVCV